MPVSKRIKGLDIARGLAVLIMILVNFRVVLADPAADGWLVAFLNMLQGKGAALFVVLAGVGISLMLKQPRKNGDLKAIKLKRTILLKRAAFLLIFGLVFMLVWPADILHYYGFFISIGTLMALTQSRWLWVLSILIVLAYPFLLDVVDYDAGWDWQNILYTELWTPIGFIRNLLVNGFHPVIPWLAFIFTGLWLGRQDFCSHSFLYRTLIIASGFFLLANMLSKLLLTDALSETSLPSELALALFGTQPMPPLPLYMISATSFSFVTIIACVLLAEKYQNKYWVAPMIATGKMAFTIYVAHILFGIRVVEVFYEQRTMQTSYVFILALGFSIFSIWFSQRWLKHFSGGPMSLLMRRISG